jgi:hypothetical protein
MAADHQPERKVVGFSHRSKADEGISKLAQECKGGRILRGQGRAYDRKFTTRFLVKPERFWIEKSDIAGMICTRVGGIEVAVTARSPQSWTKTHRRTIETDSQSNRETITQP